MYLTSEDLHLFFSELEGLIRAGIPLGPDLELDSAHDSRRIREVWSRITPRLERGEKLSEILQTEVPQIGDSTLTLIRAGEQSGGLLTALEVVAESHHRRLSLERCLRLSTFYPMLIILFQLGVLLFYGRFITPVIQHAIAQSGGGRGGQLPHLFWILNLSLWAVSPEGLIVIGVITALAIWFMTHGIWRMRGLHRRIFTAVPLFGPMMQLDNLSRWTHTLGHLLKRRVTMETALALAETSLEFNHLRVESAKIRTLISEGNPLSVALLSTHLLPKHTAGALMQSEKEGRLDEGLIRLSDHLSERLDFQISKVEAWLEPILIIFVGMLVIWQVIALFLPLFGVPRFII